MWYVLTESKVISYRSILNFRGILIKINKQILFLTIYYFVNATNLHSANQVVYRVPIQGVIDLGLPTFIERIIDEAEKNQAQAIIFDIDKDISSLTTKKIPCISLHTLGVFEFIHV